MVTIKLGEFKKLKKHVNYEVTMREIWRLQRNGIALSRITLKSTMNHLSISVGV